MNVTREELFAIADNIWTSFLGLQIREIPDKPALDRPMLSSCVHIAGTWSGAVTIACSSALARRIASVMFGMEEAEIGEGETRDALGEVANIAGGNFKAMLPQGCELSLPTVVEGSDFKVMVGGARCVTELSLECEGNPIFFNILEREQ